MRLNFFNIWRMCDKHWGNIELAEFAFGWGEGRVFRLRLCLLGFAVVITIGRDK
jgi:hypothetical protein